MRRDGKHHRAWRRQDGKPETSPEEVFRELGRREMRDLEMCRRVWERQGDPLALCEAVRQSSLPDWLANALLVMLTDGAGSYPSLRRRWWRDRRRDAIDAERAAQIAMLRAHPEEPQTWETSVNLANELSRERYEDMPSVGPSEMKRAYARVSDRLWKHPYRYYRARPGLSQRVREAWVYLHAVIKEVLTSPKK